MSKKNILAGGIMALSNACAAPQLPITQEQADRLAEMTELAADISRGNEEGSFEGLIEERRDKIWKLGLIDTSDWREIHGQNGSHPDLSTSITDHEGNKWVLDQKGSKGGHARFKYMGDTF